MTVYTHCAFLDVVLCFELLLLFHEDIQMSIGDSLNLHEVLKEGTFPTLSTSVLQVNSQHDS